MNTSYSPDWAAQAVSREIAVGDTTLFVRQWGNTGPEVVLIHGGPDWDHSYFFPFVLPLTDHCRLTTFDLRGCGRSTRFGQPERYSLDRAADDLALLLQHLDLTQVTLLGFSFGGRVALRLVDRYPAQAARLILASTTAYEDYQDDLEAWDEYQQRHPPAKQAATRLIWASKTLTGEQKTRTLALESAVRCTSRRELHLKARGLPGDRDGMSALLQDQPIAREMWHRVLDCAKRSYDMNRANGCLIEARIGRNRQALAVMRPEAGMAATYRNDGQMQHAMSGRALGVG